MVAFYKKTEEYYEQYALAGNRKLHYQICQIRKCSHLSPATIVTLFSYTY